MFIVYSYFVYLAISLAVTVWVARTLHRRGRIFLVDAFQGHEELADSINHLLVVGFYLINVGYVTFALKTVENPSSLRQAIEVVSDKLGIVLLVLGLMHFFNLFVFSRIRKRAQENNAPPPFPPDAILTPIGRPQES
jgi:TRAP-type C4-dicarboxylate transport system permease large subunit